MNRCLKNTYLFEERNRSFCDTSVSNAIVLLNIALIQIKINIFLELFNYNSLDSETFGII